MRLGYDQSALFKVHLEAPLVICLHKRIAPIFCNYDHQNLKQTNQYNKNKTLMSIARLIHRSDLCASPWEVAIVTAPKRTHPAAGNNRDFQRPGSVRLPRKLHKQTYGTHADSLVSKYSLLLFLRH